MAAAMPIWATVTARTIAAQRPRARPAGSVRRVSRATSTQLISRKAKAKARWVQCSEAQEPGVKVGHLGAEQDHHEPEPRGRLHHTMPAVSLPGRQRALPSGRLPGPEGHHQERGKEDHRVGQVDDDDPRREDQLDGDGAQKDLDHEQHGGEGGRPAEGRLGPVPPPGHQRHGQDEEAHQGGGPPVADLDQGREVERREPLAVTKGPMIPAPHAGAGDPHHPTQNDQPERQSRSDPGQPPEETGAVGKGLETQGMRPPQVSGGKERCAAVPCQRYI